MAIQADDRIDVAFTNLGTATREIAVARLQANGTLDPSFGVGGIVTTNQQVGDQAMSVALQANGQIVVAGEELGNSTGYNLGDFSDLDTMIKGNHATTSNDDIFT